ncbi:MAG TPA: 16S rRNA (guanine(966)-N(2))-methyltransferase RsmD [Gammaproteobacteria bacterium]|jgi:16S rRNA (guanine966-N2)-methyltransferase|nr:16S rRNA (guanine(966)-N(2))-methyltransferase RsmD [Gammaproteobacteria bacterium]
MPRTKNAPFQRNRGRLRIIGGQWKRHTLHFNGGADLRPTPDAIREKLFNWLAPVIEGAYCLDLFCGSGALGFEAASRGAAQVVLVDNNRQCCEEINKNCVRLGAQQIRVHCEDALEWLARSSQAFDIVFLDPPYNSDLARRSIVRLQAHPLAPGTMVYVETERRLKLTYPEHWEELRSGYAGQVSCRLFQITFSDQSDRLI